LGWLVDVFRSERTGFFPSPNAHSPSHALSCPPFYYFPALSVEK
jgi:hypothetical protein